MQIKHREPGWLRLLVVGLAVALPGSRSLADDGRETPSDPIRPLDGFAQPGRWVAAELELQASADSLANGRPTLHVHIDVDHTRPENSPIGWPRLYLQLEPEEKGWDEQSRFEFLIQGRSDRPRESGIPAVFHVMCPDKAKGAGVAIQLTQPDVWTKVSVPISAVGNLDRLGALHFYIGEKHYEHGEQIDFYLGAFRLVRDDATTAQRRDEAVQITTLDTYVVENFETLAGWEALDDARYSQAESAVVGGGALRVELPGKVRKQLRSWPVQDLLAWENSQGLSFWVQGDGSDQFGCLSLQGWSGRLSYVHYFPLRDREWRKFGVVWQDFVPQGQYEPIGSSGGLSPAGGIDSITLGDRWTSYHNDQPLPHFSYAIDHLKIERHVQQPAPAPASPPMDEVLQRLRERKPFHIVCLGDSITSGAALADADSQRYAVQLQTLLGERLQYDGVRVESRGVGGARTTDARAWVDRDLNGQPPDLVTILYGYNDKKLYSREFFQRSLDDLIDRIARKTSGRTGILLLTTPPGTGPAYSLLDGFAQAVRELGERRGIAVFDLHQAIKQSGTRPEIESTYFADMAHPNGAGHKLIARSLADYLFEDGIPR